MSKEYTVTHSLPGEPWPPRDANDDERQMIASADAAFGHRGWTATRIPGTKVHAALFDVGGELRVGFWSPHVEIDFIATLAGKKRDGTGMADAFRHGLLDVKVAETVRAKGGQGVPLAEADATTAEIAGIVGIPPDATVLPASLLPASYRVEQARAVVRFGTLKAVAGMVDGGDAARRDPAFANLSQHARFIIS